MAGPMTPFEYTLTPAQAGFAAVLLVNSLTNWPPDDRAMVANLSVYLLAASKSGKTLNVTVNPQEPIQ